MRLKPEVLVQGMPRRICECAQLKKNEASACCEPPTRHTVKKREKRGVWRFLGDRTNPKEAGLRAAYGEAPNVASQALRYFAVYLASQRSIDDQYAKNND